MNFQKNQEVIVEISDIGTNGEGIGKIDGYTLFVKDAVVGDTVKAGIVKPKKNYAYARTIEVITPSMDRVVPKCPVSRQCGGCTLQAISYDKQLELKERKIRENLIRIGGFGADEIDRVMEPIVGMENEANGPFQYRNKAQYPIGKNKDGKVIAGFYAGRTHSIISNTDCILGKEQNKEILEIIISHMNKYGIPSYNEETQRGLVRHVLIRSGFESGQIMVCLVLNTRKSGNDGWIKKESELVSNLSEIQGMTSISVNLNTDNTNVVLGNELHTIWGTDRITDTLYIRDMKTQDFKRTKEALSFSISPLSFYQVNPVQTEKLYSQALEYAGLTGNETVWDLYCGIGTISLFMATKAKKVCGVEIVPEAIEDARKNAKENGITNAEFIVGKAEEVLPAYYSRQMKACNQAYVESGIETNPEKNNEKSLLHPDVIVVDPPRKGCDEACLDTMLQMSPDRIVYISCDSATLARDLRILVDGGYEIKRLRGYDQFCQTNHVECAVLLSRAKAK